MPRSYAQTIQAPCPNCDQLINLQIWLIVDLAERPDLVERVRAGDLHAIHCPHCGHIGKGDVPLPPCPPRSTRRWTRSKSATRPSAPAPSPWG